MSKTLKRSFLIIPILIFAALFFSAGKINAAPKIYQPDTKIGDFYFTNDNVITITSKEQFAFEAFVKYRVISPVGKYAPGKRMTTEWIKEMHSDSSWGALNGDEYAFDIRFTTLNFTKEYTDEGTLTPSIAGDKATYYIELQYYEALFGSWFSSHKKNYDKTLMVVRWSESPEMQTTRNGTSFRFVATTESLLLNAKYMYTVDEVAGNEQALLAAYASATEKADVTNAITDGQLDFTKPDVKVNDPTYNYFYLMTKDANGNFGFTKVNLQNGNIQDDSEDNEGGLGNKPGLLSNLGTFEVVLIVLVAVLLVSSGLIVTQKIMERKKVKI